MKVCITTLVILCHGICQAQDVPSGQKTARHWVRKRLLKWFRRRMKQINPWTLERILCTLSNPRAASGLNFGLVKAISFQSININWKGEIRYPELFGSAFSLRDSPWSQFLGCRSSSHFRSETTTIGWESKMGELKFYHNLSHIDPAPWNRSRWSGHDGDQFTI